MKRTIGTLFAILLAFLLVPGTIAAEPFFSVFGGVAAPQDADIKDTTGTVSDFDLDLDTSFTTGFKVGWWFLPWLGVEGDFVYARPDVSDQTVTLVVPGAGAGPFIFKDVSQEMIGGGFSILGRIPSEKFGGFEPYLGVGLTILNIRLPDIVGVVPPFVTFFPSESDTAFGPQAQAGARYFFTPQIAFGLEYQFRRVEFEFKNLAIEETLTLHSFVGVISWHFR